MNNRRLLFGIHRAELWYLCDPSYDNLLFTNIGSTTKKKEK